MKVITIKARTPQKGVKVYLQVPSSYTESLRVLSNKFIYDAVIKTVQIKCQTLARRLLNNGWSEEEVEEFLSEYFHPEANYEGLFRDRTTLGDVRKAFNSVDQSIIWDLIDKHYVINRQRRERGM